MRLHGLHELGALREALRTGPRAAAEAAAARERCERERCERERGERARCERARAEGERRAFADAVGAVTPLAHAPRAEHRLERPAPLPRQRALDEEAALRATWSDIVDVESLLHTDDALSFRRPEVGPDVPTRLRRGHWAIQAQLDLHGLRRDAAREALAAFLAAASRQGWRCVRVVHGKGLGSPGRAPVLKAKVQRWLAHSDAVLAFAQAGAAQGGAGALVVLLAGGRREAGGAGGRRQAGGAGGGAVGAGAGSHSSMRAASATSASEAAVPGSVSSSSWRRSTASRTAGSAGTSPSSSMRTGASSVGLT